jgi:hypothetical protein
VRLNGKLYEAVVSRFERRRACDLYHSALVVRAREGRFVVEQAPVWRTEEERGVVCEGVVGARWLGRFRLFRYELRCWRDGVIPDIDEAVDSPRSLTDDPEIAQHVIDLAPAVPSYVWGRKTLNAREMWNSNSAISWLLSRSGIDAAAIHPPVGGRAPGWAAGVVVAKRAEARA